MQLCRFDSSVWWLQGCEQSKRDLQQQDTPAVGCLGWSYWMLTSMSLVLVVRFGGSQMAKHFRLVNVCYPDGIQVWGFSPSKGEPVQECMITVFGAAPESRRFRWNSRSNWTCTRHHCLPSPNKIRMNSWCPSASIPTGIINRILLVHDWHEKSHHQHMIPLATPMRSPRHLAFYWYLDVQFQF